MERTSNTKLGNALGRGALALVLGGIIWLAGCATYQESTPRAGEQQEPQRAIATLAATKGNKAQGTVTFTGINGGVRVVAEISGLTPGKHGFHVHEKGDCSAPDASSAGGHFNPTGMPHGGPNFAQRHVGDFGNIVADESGRARAEFIDTHIALDGPRSILGRGLVVHAKADDLISQPSGDAGDRVACGVIQRSQ
jgi:Cu-Zn family superoxide dismutase